MPTPSSNAPDPQSPRSFSFSTCPEPDEHQHQSQPETQDHPQSPSTWRPSPPPYSAAVQSQLVNMDDDTGEMSRSPTRSPELRRSATDQDLEPDGVIVGRDLSDESHKQADTDEEMSGTSGEVMGGQGVGRADRETSGSRAARRTATEIASTMRRRQADLPSPGIGEVEDIENWDLQTGATRWVEDSGLAGLGYEFTTTRLIPTTSSSYLRPGSRFTGTQQSERQRYDVQVEIKHVDMRESFLCGYLRIQGLTDDHPTLTTYFEGEIIGTKYGFITQHPSWGATEKIDLSHWNKFTAFRPHQKQARKGQVVIKDVAQKENIFMRWKEHFLVPDHRVRTINGASFEGFYYICFNQVRGEVSGIYFHSKSEKFQQLELKHVENKGCFGAMEFR